MSIKKLLAAILALIMVFSLCACVESDRVDRDDDDDSRKINANKKDDEEEDPLVGEWIGTMDMTEYMAEIMAAEDMGEYLELDDISIDLIFTFKKNGKYEASIDEDSAEKMVENLLTAVVKGMVAMLEDQGVSLEDAGMTEDDLWEALESEIDPKDLVEELEDSFEAGYYVFDGDMIYVGADKDELEEDPEEYAEEIYEVELKGNTLKIVDVITDGESLDEEIPGVLPIKMKKQ